MRLWLAVVVLALAGCRKSAAVGPRLTVPSMGVALTLPGFSQDAGTLVVALPRDAARAEQTVSDGELSVRATVTDWSRSGGSPNLKDCIEKLAGPLANGERRFESPPQVETLGGLDVARGTAQVLGAPVPSRGRVLIFHDGAQCLTLDAYVPQQRFTALRERLDALLETISDIQKKP